MIIMTELASRLQNARNELKLSQEYVAKQLNISRASISQIELGKRKVSSDELAMFCRLYRLSADELLMGRSLELPSLVFARKFNEMDDSDQHEILSLIEFKRMMKEQKNR
jgi:transcriptional regulator with XRE-family HTH domain